ncbi:DUF1176 domain-containing protein [Caulobacter radicis]|uniref:DUF1176 domain-containing protein n=1 Tax=Caulobacter radicis TaxID=2172650 RepID=UPI001401FE51|nr:DUF1176 domain-containing protein [Caulobacter radicis]
MALAVGVASASAPARADDWAFEKDRWFAACDGLSTCTAWAMGGGGSGHVILVEKANGERALTIGAARGEVANRNRPLAFRIDVAGRQGRPLWARLATGFDPDRQWLNFRTADPATIDAAVRAIEAGDRLRVRVEGRPDFTAQIPLAGATAALAWARGHDRRDAERAAVGRAPAVSQADLPRAPPPLAFANYDEGCAAGQGGVQAARLAPGKVLWIGTCGSGYNRDAVLALTDEAGAALPLAPPTDPDGEAPVHNLAYDPATRLLSAVSYAGAGRDCGEALRWAWDGAAFRLVERAELSGDYCQGVTEKDWPVLYRARIVDQ